MEAGVRGDTACGGAYAAYEYSGPRGRRGAGKSHAAFEAAHRFAAARFDPPQYARADDPVGKAGVGQVSQSDGEVVHARAAWAGLDVGSALQCVRSFPHAAYLRDAAVDQYPATFVRRRIHRWA